MLVIPLTKGFSALIDDEDAHLADLKWSVQVSAGGKGLPYAVRATSRKDPTPRRLIFLHHQIVGRPAAGLVVDHVNGNSLDNRRANLQIISHRANIQKAHPCTLSAQNPAQQRRFAMNREIDGYRQGIDLMALFQSSGAPAAAEL